MIQKINRKRAPYSLAVLLILFSPLCFSAEPQPPQNTCIECHTDQWDELKNSIHGQQGITCDRCHGGDPTQKEAEKAKSKTHGYIGVPNKQQMVEKCGGCHQDIEAMNFYGVRTDQLARYKTSTHGKKLLLEGDEHVAGCSDCHGYHDVLRISDPKSPVYPSNVPKTCNRCHGNEKLMSSYNLPANHFELYKTSVHAKALLEKKDLSAANCVSCHGSHGAAPPGVHKIGAACGQCHINEKKYFFESVHAPAAEKETFSECISCHGNHAVQNADITLYQSVCTTCHEAGSKAAAQGTAIFQILEQSETELKSAEETVKKAASEGIFVELETGQLEEAKTNVMTMAPLQHSLSIERITEVSKKFIDLSAQIKKEIAQKRRFRIWRKVFLIPLWIFIALMVWALWNKYKQVRHGKGS